MCIHMCVYIYIYACMLIYLHIYVSVYTCVYIYSIYTNINVHTYINTYKHTYIYPILSAMSSLSLPRRPPSPQAFRGSGLASVLCRARWAVARELGFTHVGGYTGVWVWACFGTCV